MAANAREVAVDVVRALRGGGHVAYLAGGCVRDEILGADPKDYDVATDATPERIASLFRRTRAVGKAFGVMQVQDRGVTVEVATFRREHGYSDGRRPDRVEFADAEQDAHRRDFTINALFIDPLSERVNVAGVRGEVIDFVGGLADIERRVIRAVGDAEARLSEDNLRALRAVRFTARLGFTLDGATAGAIRRRASALEGVSRERIGDEIRRMLLDGSRAESIRLIEVLGLDGPVLEESGFVPRGGVVVRTLGRDASVVAALAAWAVDRHGPTGGIDALVGRWRAALCLSNDETEDLRRVLGMVEAVRGAWGGLGVARRKRLAASARFADAMLVVCGLDAGLASAVLRDVEALAQSASGLAPEPLLTGDGLVAAGVKPGRGFGVWLDAVYDAQLEGRVRTAEEALAMGLRLAGAE